MIDNEIGNGTIAMNALIKYAKKIEAKYIDGTLSLVDVMDMQIKEVIVVNNWDLLYRIHI